MNARFFDEQPTEETRSLQSSHRSIYRPTPE